MKVENTPLIDTLFPMVNLSKSVSFIRFIGLSFFSSLLLWVSAKIQIPFWPIPITFQTMVVLLIGVSFGWKLGVTSLGFYYLQGIVGLPVFANSPERGLGLAYILGPTGGYLLGFFLAVLISSLGSNIKLYKTYCGGITTYFGIAILLLLSNLAIYIPGILWLSKFYGFEKALAVGFYPFILGDFIKIFLIVLLAPTIYKVIKK